MRGATGGELNNVPVPPRPVLPIPDAVGVAGGRPTSTQETFGRILTRLADVAGVGERIVTTSPDVSVSTNLGGWINKMGVFAPDGPARLPRRRTGCCGGSRRRPATTSSSASAR